MCVSTVHWEHCVPSHRWCGCHCHRALSSYYDTDHHILNCMCVSCSHSSVSASYSKPKPDIIMLVTNTTSQEHELCVCLGGSPRCLDPGWLCRALEPGTFLGEGCWRSCGFGCLVRTGAERHRRALCKTLPSTTGVNYIKKISHEPLDRCERYLLDSNH